MSVLAKRLIEIHDGLTKARLAHAFGGAIALAYCTEEPRSTRDLDINVFVSPSRAAEVFTALPEQVAYTVADIEKIEREGQVRIWWEDTPIDLFLDVHRFHEEVAERVRQVPFAGRTIPVLDCTAIAVFKALFDRTKDWADIEAMIDAEAMDVADALTWIESMVGLDHPAAQRMASLLA